MGALSPSITTKLAKMLPMLASDRDGEVVATAAAIGRVLAGAGASWHDVAALLSLPPAQRPATAERQASSMAFSFIHLSPEGARRRVAELLAGSGWNDWERRFLTDMENLLRGKARNPLSCKQAQLLTDLYCRHWGVKP
ncbi:hypothetical protein [Niveispirillum sp.]|uniref:hypothetical protein n=1 Tax=Niveispirillum sp. TaxID=1917217 RepID=UPI001B47AEA2|nr:hypothetical protein [Niveispirillum sp.]MBP7334938.1 hypothetical protein [Niveispirillum sp.]